MDAWLTCKVSTGMFSSEYTVEGTSWDGIGFSLFAPKDDVVILADPMRQEPVEGQMRVEVVEQKGDLVLVMLPRESLECGRYITVGRQQLHRKSPQAA
jgi:hypothetical protein